MNEQTTTYLKPLTEQEQKRFAQFGTLNQKEFDELKQLAIKCYKGEQIKNKPINFDNNFVWITSGDLHGFFCVSGRFFEFKESNKQLKAICFKQKYNITFSPHTRTPAGFEAVAVYEDERENYYTTGKAIFDRAPLEKWQEETKKSIEETEAQTLALCNIKQVYKKDGGQFANVQKNFEGCTVKESRNICGDFLGYDITVSYYHGELLRFGSLTIYASTTDGAKSFNEIMPAIKKAINKKQQELTKQEEILQHCEQVYNEIMRPMFETVLKYETPTNSQNITINYLLHRVGEWVKDFYIRK